MTLSMLTVMSLAMSLSSGPQFVSIGTKQGVEVFEGGSVGATFPPVLVVSSTGSPGFFGGLDSGKSR